MQSRNHLVSLVILGTSDSPRLRTGATTQEKFLKLSVYLYYIMYVPIIHIILSLESLYLFKKTHQNPLNSVKDLSIHSDSETKSDFVLYISFCIHVVISNKEQLYRHKILPFTLAIVPTYRCLLNLANAIKYVFFSV